MTLKDKVELYENFLNKIANIETAELIKEALEGPNNPASGRGDTSKYPFAFGVVEQALKGTVTDARYALSQGKK